MNIEPTVIYGAFGAIVAGVVALWAVVMADHRNCQRNVSLLTRHTIAQQVDINRMVQDRADRGLPRQDLESEKTEFYRRHREAIEPMEGI